MGRQSSSTCRMEGRPFRFLPEEVKEMEERLFPVTKRRLDHILMDELAVKFSYFRGLAGMTPVKSNSSSHEPFSSFGIRGSIDLGWGELDHHAGAQLVS